MASSKFSVLVVATAGVMLPMSVMATEFDFNFGNQDFNAVLNQTLTAGVAFRIEAQDSRLIGKSDIDPNVCAGVYQLCQGLNRTQSYPAEKLRRSPGAASMNFDDGDLNFNRGDVTQSPVVWTHDLKIESGKFGFFYRGRAIYDPALYHGQVHYRNRITSANVNSVGTAEAGNRTSNRYFPRTYGAGGAFNESRNEQEAQQIGLRYDFLDTNFFGSIPIPGDRELQFRLGRQTVQWGESTVAILKLDQSGAADQCQQFFPQRQWPARRSVHPGQHVPGVDQHRRWLERRGLLPVRIPPCRDSNAGHFQFVRRSWHHRSARLRQRQFRLGGG